MYNILVLNSDTDGGVLYFRFLMPHYTLDKSKFNVEFRLLNDHSLPLLDERYISRFNAIIYNKNIGFQKKEFEDIFYAYLKKYNIKLIYDIDDYFILDNSHINYKSWKENKGEEMVVKNLKNADAVITTTPLFAEILKKYNKNTFVLENAINFNECQWCMEKSTSEKVRFFWGGGITHLPDLRLMKDDFKKFDKNFISNSQMIMAGYDLRMRLPNGSMTKDNPQRSQWTHFEHIFTDNWKHIDSLKYRDFLTNSSNFDNDMNYGYNDDFKNDFYQRRWTKPFTTYGDNLKDVDVILAPLNGIKEGSFDSIQMFNYCKSQLKILEAGCYKCPAIVSNFAPYTIDDIDGIKDGKRKGFTIDNKKGGWYEKMKYYVDNKNALIEHGMNLHEYIKNNYSVDVINQKRALVYENTILNKEIDL